MAGEQRRSRRTPLLATALGLALLVAAIVAVGVTVLARPAHAPGSASEEGDCSTFLHVRPETYAMLMGGHVHTLRPGPHLGTGTFDPCREIGYSPGSNRSVYAVPGVPRREAVLVLGPHRRGALFVNLERPAAGWSARLAGWFRVWHTQPTTR